VEGEDDFVKNIVVRDSKLNINCDFYMCMSRATKVIETPDAPPGQCVRVCDDHYKAMKKAFVIYDDLYNKKIAKTKEDEEAARLALLQEDKKKKQADEDKKKKEEEEKAARKKGNIFLGG
jgi:hypothetical protein